MNQKRIAMVCVCAAVVIGIVAGILLWESRNTGQTAVDGTVPETDTQTGSGSASDGGHLLADAPVFSPYQSG